MPESRYYHISQAGELKRLSLLKEVLEARASGGYIWLDYTSPTEKDLAALIEPLGIHPLSVEDCLDEEQIPKVEDFPSNTFLLVNNYRHAGGELTIGEVDFILGRNFLVSVHGRAEEAPWTYGKLEEAIGLDRENVRTGPDFLLHLVLDYTVDHKYLAIESLQDEIDGAEEKILNDPSNCRPQELMRLRRQLLSLRKSLFHEREILVKICRRDSPFISEKAIYHYRDIYDHLAKYFETVEICREMITSLMEMYLSTINNQMALVANRTNRVMRRLTLITTIFMPLTLLAGIGGMSEWSMMTGPHNWKIAYPAFLLGMLVIGIANYYALRWVDTKGQAVRGKTTARKR